MEVYKPVCILCMRVHVFTAADNNVYLCARERRQKTNRKRKSAGERGSERGKERASAREGEREGDLSERPARLNMSRYGKEYGCR